MSDTQAALVGAGIKSIQRGVISLTGTNLTGTATITAVVTAKTELRFLGFNNNQALAADPTLHIVLTNTTTITATRLGATSANCAVSWELTERY